MSRTLRTPNIFTRLKEMGIAFSMPEHKLGRLTGKSKPLNSEEKTGKHKLSARCIWCNSVVTIHT